MKCLYHKTSIVPSNRIQIMQYSDLLSRLRALQRSTCQIANLRTYFTSKPGFPSTITHWICKKYAMPINVLTFIQRNAQMLTADKAMNTHLEQQIQLLLPLFPEMSTLTFDSMHQCFLLLLSTESQEILQTSQVSSWTIKL